MKKKEIFLKAEKRDELTKGQLKLKRKEGYAPAIVYGPDIDENIKLFVKSNETIKILKDFGENHPINIEVDGKKILTIIKDFDYNILKEKLIHVDFYTVSSSHALITNIPIEFVGISKGEKEGGIAEKFLHHIEVEGTIDNIPEKIVINMEPLTKGTTIFVRDLEVPEGVKILENPEEVVLVIKGHATETVAETTSEEATAEDLEKVKEIFDE